MHLPQAAHLARISSNPRSYRVLRRLLGADDTACGQARQAVELRPLNGRTVWLRPGTTDAQVVWDTFLGRYHLPPDDLHPGVIWDLGSNIGLTAAHLAVCYPRARIVGVELDAANAALARDNVAPWRDRCDIRDGAVWTEDREIAYEGAPGNEHGFRVSDGAGTHTASAVSLDTLLRREGRGADYVKMDIEGAECAVLRTGTDWATAVRAIKVEVHGGYTVEQCVKDLSRLGFRARVDQRHWACAVGSR